MQIEPSKSYTITLTGEQLDAVLRLVAEGPWRVTNPIITGITQQLVAVDQKGIVGTDFPPDSGQHSDAGG